MNLRAAHTNHRVEVDGCEIEYLLWPSRPLTTCQQPAGLLFVHGGNAHADWWTPLAPFFTDEYRVAALSNSGSGGSGWRPQYSFDLWAQELLAVARHAGMVDEQRCKPIVVAHSLGVAVALRANRLFSEHFGGMILIDEVPCFRCIQPSYLVLWLHSA